MFSPQRQSNGRRRHRPSARRTQVQPWMLWTAVILAVAALALGIYLIFLRPYHVDKNLTQLGFGPDANWTTTSDTLYYTQGSQLYASNFRTQEKWNTTTSTDGMRVSASSKQVAVYSDTQVQCYDASSNLKYAKEFVGAIQSVRCGDTYLAVHVKESSGLYRLVVLDAAGNDHNISLEGKYVVDYGYYQGDNLYLHTLDGLSVTPSAMIETMDGSLNSTGKISIQGQLLQNIVFFPDHLYAVGTNHLYDIGYVGDQRDSKLIYGWNYFGYVQPKNGEPMFAFVPGGAFSGSENITTVRLCSLSGSDVYIQMKANTRFVFMGNGKLFTIAESVFTSYDLTGKETGSYQLPFAPQKIHSVGSGSHIGLSTADAVYLLKLP